MGRKLRFVFRVLLPFSAMKQTVHLLKKETKQTKENLIYIKKLAGQAKGVIKAGKSEKRDEKFEDVLSRCSLSRMELYQIFICKKRIIISAFFLITLTTLFSMTSTFITNNMQGFFLCIIAFIMSQCLFFIMLFQYQLRLWQLRTKRLSISEKGGISDFIREENWFQLLNPEFGYKNTKEFSE